MFILKEFPLNKFKNNENNCGERFKKAFEILTKPEIQFSLGVDEELD